MPIIAARRYSAGNTEDHVLTLDGQPRQPLPPDSFDWIGLCEPTADEMEQARRQFDLHPLAVEDALNPTQLPKVEVYGPALFIVARTAELGDGETIVYGQTALFLGRDYLVTVRFGSSRAHNPVRERVEAHTERLAEGVDYVAHAILDFIVDGFQPIIDRFEDAVQAMEERAIDTFPQPSTIRRIFRLRRQIRRFERIAGPMEEVCERLATADLPVIDPGARIWFRDVLDHSRRALARMRGLKETLASIVETAGLLEQHRQGEMTRQLAAWAAILAVPTAIAGIYGMNFEYMPELRWRYGYFVVVGLIGTICLGLWWRFRRIGWL
ncbi:magnesium and cobalt transport protein CorA [Novosphingobium piscinae]|uniref:Magnesium and cobalt transport protein CorA n=1 Tax=Novosphingobium piscinae TaxID=1507448 RepID=A0A7X1G1J7_9SPHN|nr:magnesium and cobalt transport protein CorA [Novosphingobium piscinae]MBC2670926.1 magnesium and cobalt transport protein CorA [Novosphingobium piscinae]